MQKVICAMSGGVDSSVSAALLKERGYNIIGVFMGFWGEEENKCCSEESGMQARRAAKKLKIPLYTFNFKNEFKSRVVDYYIHEYEKGRTPNPCVVCNQQIKFGLLMERAKAMGAKLATGHYARIGKLGETGESSKIRYKLLRGKDKTKDQSYFLWKLTNEKLKNIIFPVGDLSKREVRRIAKENDLATATRADSQGICFIPGKGNRAFLRKYAKNLLELGDVVDLKREKIGRHKGLYHFTVGQRQGLELGDIVWTKQPKQKPPLYVISLDIKKNVLIVGEEKDLCKKEMVVGDVNWINEETGNPKNHKGFGAGRKQETGLKCEVQIRYQHEAVLCELKRIDKDRIKTTFKEPERAITPGQSAVFYEDNEVLGGGVILE